MSRPRNSSGSPGPRENWLEFVAGKFPYRDRANASRLLDGLRKAGLLRLTNTPTASPLNRVRNVALN